MENIKYSERKTSITHMIGEGHYGIAYKYGDVVIKKYFDNRTANGHIKADMFDSLKEVKEKAFIDLIDCSCSTIQHFDGYEQKVISAYSSKYINKTKRKSIDMPMDYTLNSLYELYKVANILNDMGIKMNDESYDNLIVSKDNIVIIDPDYYAFDKRLVAVNNIISINEYIIDLWCHEYGIKEEDDVSRFLISKIFYDKCSDDYLINMENR